MKPEFFQDEKVGGLTPLARLLFLGLITMADDEGRLRELLGAINGHVFPYDALSGVKIKRLLAEVEATGLIVRYAAGLGHYIVIRHWGRHQRINKPVDSTLPPPPDLVIVEENSFADSGEARLPRGTIPEAVRRAVARREGATPGATTEVGCHYCARPGSIVWPTIASGRASSWVTIAGLEFDHVIPVALGGGHTLDNLVLACARCNRSKGARELGTESRTDDVRNPVQSPVPDPSRAGARSIPFLSVPEVPEPAVAIDAGARKRDGEIEAVMAAWRESTGHPGAQLDKKRRAIIAAALKTHPVDDLVDAVRGWRHSKHHRGENERSTIYNELRHLIGDVERIERFRDLERGAALVPGRGRAAPNAAELATLARLEAQHAEEDRRAHSASIAGGAAA